LNSAEKIEATHSSTIEAFHQHTSSRGSKLSRLDVEGRLVDGDAPSKEAFLHRAMYGERADCGAVVHLHSVHSVAVSCLDGLDAHDVFPPITAYAVMQVGRLALVPYFPPGDAGLAGAVADVATRHHAVLLRNHGPVIAGTDLESAIYATEELEETAKLFLLLRGERLRLLSKADVAELERRFQS
jgi:ribulose-5-phosphate 4-epimerase/fuculose-1-phosphate aldolase